jgi:hypothetical protein
MVLSGDQDFFRYRDANYQLFSSYKIHKGRIKLIPAVLNPKRIISKRNIIAPPPRVVMEHPSLTSLDFGFYLKGVVSPLVKRFGNPVLDARPLRAALYFALGIKDPITEITPFFNGTTVEWTNDSVQPNPKFEMCLRDPIRAMQVFFAGHSRKPKDIEKEQWSKHLFAIRGIIAEICSVAMQIDFCSIVILLQNHHQKSKDNKN